MLTGAALLLASLAAQAQPLMRDFIGVNVKPQLPYERMTKVGNARAFHLWADDQSNAIVTDAQGTGVPTCALPVPANSALPKKIRWNPSYNGNRYIRYDDFYKVLPQRTVAVLQGCAPIMYGNSGELQAKPICPPYQADPLNPGTGNADIQADPDHWEALAIRSSLFAARYGAAPAGGFPAGFQQLAAQNIEFPDNIGLGRSSVKYIEVFNETDAAWKSVDQIDASITGASMETNPSYLTSYYFRPDQYAAMLSAAYDGNKGSGVYLNTPWGIKKLSSNTKVVLAGTSDLRYDYLHFLRKAWDAMRGPGDYPFDIVNYHFYSTTTHPGLDDDDPMVIDDPWDKFYKGRAFFGSGQGAFPESDNIDLRGRIKRILDDRGNGTIEYPPLFPDKPTWITEFGYDTQGSTAIGLVPFCGFDAQTIQGQWVTRYFMEASASKGAAGVVDKVFMYELNDDASLGTSLFGTSGLLHSNGSPKTSWYHLRTLKSVLDATRFIKTNKEYEVAYFNDDDNVMVFDDPRMYLYSGGNDARPTIAAWVPHGSDLACNEIEYHKAVLIRKTADPNEIKPVIQVIEVVDYDEDGRRTKVDPSLIEAVNVQLPNNGPFRDFWRINGIRLGDTEFTLTETPVYLRVNQPFSESDRVVQPVLNLTASCLGCNTARLTWTWPPGQLYSYYAVYYQEIPCGTNNPVFDPQSAILLTDRLPGGSKDAVVPGLSLDPTVCYIFWVVPFVSNTNGGTSSFFTYSAADMSQPENTRHYVIWQAGTCTPCPVPFQQNEVSITQNPWVGQPFLEQSFFESLFPGTPAVICTDLASNPPPSNFGIIVGEGKTLQFVIDFDGPKYIDALYMFYASGNGRITIEYMRDCCRQWIKLSPIDVKDGTSGSNNFWYRIVNTIFNKQRIEKIRVTIEGLPETGITFRRIYLCARPAPDECAGDPQLSGVQDELLTPVSDVEVRNLDTHSAVIGWNAARHFVNNTETYPINRYTVRYSIATYPNGELVQPEGFEYEGPEWGGDNEAPLSPLVPNTTYFVDIVPSVESNPCPEQRPAARISFTTLSLETSNRDGKTSQPQPEVLIFPNPTNDLLNVQVPPDTYTRYRITHVNGVLLREGNLNPKQNAHSIALKDLPSGMYVLSLIGPNTPIWSKAFVISR